MSWFRIQAMLWRYLYLYPRSLPRILDIFFWPIVDILIWGFLTLYLREIQTNLPISIFLGALIFWNFTQRSQLAVSIAFLEEVWEKNLINIFVTPVKLVEFLAATVLVGLVRLLLVGLTLGLAGFLFFKFNIFTFGFYLVPFVVNLFFFGWILGLIATSVILRFGQSAQVLAFALTMLLQPFSAVFYPVKVLPGFLQMFSFVIPITHVFEGMRTVVLENGFPTSSLVAAVLLNLVWFVVSILLFYKMFDYVRDKGHLLKLVD